MLNHGKAKRKQKFQSFCSNIDSKSLNYPFIKQVLFNDLDLMLLSSLKFYITAESNKLDFIEYFEDVKKK